MRTTGKEQEFLQSALVRCSRQDRIEWVRDCHRQLQAASELHRYFGKLDLETEQNAAYSIETIVRAESIESGRGAFFRFFRRLALVRQYFRG